MVITKTINLSTEGNTEIIDITKDVVKCLAQSKLSTGTVVVFNPGSTGGLTTLEYEKGVIKDVQESFEKIAPKEEDYAHNTKWGDGNGFSHVRSALLGPSLSVPFSNGKLMLGTWQQIVFVDFDNRPRQREIIVQIMGE